MLNVTIVPHREFLPADTTEQKLFVMLKLSPNSQAASASPSTAFVFLIDTSSSMDEEATPQQTKRDIVMQSLKALINSGKLRDIDRVAIVQFDEEASTLIGLTPATEVLALEKAIARLREFSGGTLMEPGLRQAYGLLADQQMTSRRTVLFTDGVAFDEEACRQLTQTIATHNIPITALGVGEFNEDLLNYLSDTTGGRAFHVVTQQTQGAAIYIHDLPATIATEFQLAQQEVINNLKLSVRTVQGVQLARIVRAYPSQAEFPLTQAPYSIGNAIANDETIFILEFRIESRAASRMRIAQLGLTYDIPGQNRRGELPPQDVVVQFVAGQNFAAQVDPIVMGYVQQCNIMQLVQEATRVADQNPDQAEALIESARRLTRRIGNQAMEDSLGQAQDELRKTRKISSGTQKTIKMGSRGKTVRMEEDVSQLSEEQIRRMSGT